MVETTRRGERARRKVTSEYQINTPVLPEVFGAYESLVAALKARGVVRVDGEKMNKQLMLSTVVLMLESLTIEQLEKALTPAAKRLGEMFYAPAPAEVKGEPADILLSAAAAQTETQPDAGTEPPVRDARKVAERSRSLTPAPRKKKPGATRG